MFNTVAKVVFNDFEGGFWALIDEEGKKYCPDDDLPPNFQKEGLAVLVHFEPSSSYSTRMWGRNIRIISISALV